MAEIDFGTLVSVVADELNYTESDLSENERSDTRAALEHYKRNIIEAVRKVFDEAETPAQVPPPCTRCGAAVVEGVRFCQQCGLPLTMDAVPRWLIDTIAKDAGAAADDPRVMQAFIRLHEEDSEGWSRMMQKIEAARQVGA